jgi:hypothetical protein
MNPNPITDNPNSINHAMARPTIRTKECECCDDGEGCGCNFVDSAVGEGVCTILVLIDVGDVVGTCVGICDTGDIVLGVIVIIVLGGFVIIVAGLDVVGVDGITVEGSAVL